MPALSIGKVDKYGYLTDEKLILTSYLSGIIEQAKFTYFSLGKAL